ncbi:hypothetical protein chiPu_0024247 [Chiloscyllium punctatum]|uniref:Uncharacterized protein n=1 Tax=Chiloscyllium punctatum TaxID=137246 RepID=A0A401TCB7_CHIPU|nr:hypothetical protein [Chiloscyllium punctatum]
MVRGLTIQRLLLTIVRPKRFAQRDTGNEGSITKHYGGEHSPEKPDCTCPSLVYLLVYRPTGRSAKTEQLPCRPVSPASEPSLSPNDV